MWIIDQGQILPITKYSRILISFTCDCCWQTKRTMPWKNFGAGHSKSCGKCDYVLLKDLLNKEFGNLTISHDNDLDRIVSRNEKVKFQCICGGFKFVVLKSVLSNLTKSCGCLLNNHSAEFRDRSLNYRGQPARLINKLPKLTILPSEWWLKTKFGNLRVISVEKPIGKWSDIKLQCKCTCGNKCMVSAKHLTSGGSVSCGRCQEQGMIWWDTKDLPTYPNNLESLREFFNGSYLEPLEFSKKKLAVRCLLCSRIFKPCYHDLFLKKIVSCGCIRSSISKANKEIGKFIEELGLEVFYEHQLDKWKVDVYAPAVNLIIEHHGLIFHSDKFRPQITDIPKYQLLSRLFRYIVIYSDEWQHKKQIMKKIIASACNKLQLPKLRPKHCVLGIVDNQTAADFLNQHHYLGATRGTHIGTFYNNELIGIMTISTPTRQSKFDYEITRMASAKYRVCGVWSYILSRLPEFGLIGSFITFSDNRLSTGNVYQAMGLVRDGVVKSDYYYTNGYKRFHKSKLRKTSLERETGLTEYELRRQQNLFRIFDLGKIRWAINITT